MSRQYGTYTNVDVYKAMAYAKNRIKNLKCNDKNFKQKICKYNNAGDNGDCLSWEEDPKYKGTWDKPNYVTDRTCAVDSDCSEVPSAPKCRDGKCSNLPDDKYSNLGKCKIASGKLCDNLSEVPYKLRQPTEESIGYCRPTNCFSDDDCGEGTTRTCIFSCKKKEGDKLGLPRCDDDSTCTCKDGKCDYGSCIQDTDCVSDDDALGCDTNVGVCGIATGTTDKGKCEANTDCGPGTDGYCYGVGNCPDFPVSKHYLEWDADATQCSFGNIMLKQFCERPQCRVPGDNSIDNLSKPFVYDKGKCYISQAFCKDKNNDFENQGEVKDKSDCDANTPCKVEGDICVNQSSNISALSGQYEKCSVDDDECYCHGPTSECSLDKNVGDNIMSILIGETFYGLIQGTARNCDWNPFDSKEKFEAQFVDKDKSPMDILRQVISFDVQNTNKTTFELDVNLSLSKKKVIDDYIQQGVSLYHYIDKENPETSEFSLCSTELMKAFPNIATIQDNKIIIKLDKYKIKDSKHLQKLYTFLISKDKLTELIRKLTKITSTIQ